MDNFNDDFGRMDPLNQSEPLNEPLTPETEPLIDEEDIQLGREMIDQYHQGPGEFESEPETPPEAQNSYDEHQGLPQNSIQDVIGDGSAETEPEPLEPNEVREEWAQSDSEPNFPDSIDYTHLQDIDYSGEDSSVESMIKGLEAGLHPSKTDEKEHVTMKKEDDGAVGHQYPQNSTYETFDSGPSSYSEPQPETDPAACERPEQLVEHHNIPEYRAGAELEYIETFGETMAQTLCRVTPDETELMVDTETLDLKELNLDEYDFL